VKLVLWVAAAVLALWALTRLLEPRLTWFPLREVSADPAAYGLRFEDVSVTAADGVRLRGWYCLPRAGAPHRADLLFLSGNAGNVGHRLAKIRALAGLGLGVFIVDYRGFGASEGRPDDAAQLRDAGAVFAAAQARAATGGLPIGIYGESIGGLFAVRLAAENPDAAFLVLEGSFPGKRAVAVRLPPYWPFLPFLGGALETGPHAGRVACPVLVMHARADEVIPFALGRAVHASLTGSRLREWHEIPRGGHNDAFEIDPGFFPRIGAFLDRALPR
jgi:pimeloyl-ACP methyl ester carboxylesterase